MRTSPRHRPAVMPPLHSRFLHVHRTGVETQQNF
jgi:hypothetical protein